MADAFEIFRELLESNQRLYVRGAFCQSRRTRELLLQDAAEWFRLDAVIASVDIDLSPTVPPSQRWIALFRRVCADLPPVPKREFVAVVDVFEYLSSRHDETSAPEFWELVMTRLRADGQGPVPAQETVRGRHWLEVRRQVANVLKKLSKGDDRHVIPRFATRPSAFGDRDWRRLREQLDVSPAGIVVLHGEPGSGKTEQALHYAEYSSGNGFYDHVFWIRADHPVRIEEDFLAAADTLLDVRPPQRGAKFREAMAKLERTDGWLLVFDGVTDPTRLLPWIPRNPRGHILCTSWSKDRREVTGAWERYFNVDVSLPGSATRALDIEQCKRILGTDGQPASSLERELVELVHGSPSAVSVAARWVERHPDMGLAGFVDAYRARAGTVGPALARLREWGEADAVEGSPIPLSDSYVGLIPPDNDVRGPRPRPGIIAAAVMLDEASDEQSEVRGQQLGLKAVELVERLGSFAAGAIPVDALDDAVTPTAKLRDQRLAYLEDLGLAAVSTLRPGRPSFEVHQDVRLAAQAIAMHGTTRNVNDHDVDRAFSAHVRKHRSVAASTALTALCEPRSDRSADVHFESLPHLAQIAWYLVQGAHPHRLALTAIELYARAAATYASLGFPSAAALQLRRAIQTMTTNHDELVQTLEQGFEDWSDLAELSNPARSELLAPGERLALIVTLLRRSGLLLGSDEFFLAVRHLYGDPRIAHLENGEWNARLLFEGGIVRRDRTGGRGAAPVGPSARELFDDSAEIFRAIGLDRWAWAAESMIAVCDSDDGLLVPAQQRFDDVVARLESAMGESPNDDATRTQLARARLRSGRNRVLLGQLEEAAADFARSRRLWEAAWAESHQNPRAVFGHRADVQAQLALAEAQLGRPDALELAAGALELVDDAQLGGHLRALIVLRHADVLALTGDELLAIEPAEQAIADIGRYWGPMHPIYRNARLSVADILRYVGRLNESAGVGLRLLEGVGRRPDGPWGDSHVEGMDGLTRGRAWTRVARVLLDSAPYIRLPTDSLPSHLVFRGRDGESRVFDLILDALELVDYWFDASGISPSALARQNAALLRVEVCLRTRVHPRPDDLRALSIIAGPAFAATTGTRSSNTDVTPLSIVAAAKELRLDAIDASSARAAELLDRLATVQDASGWPLRPTSTRDRVEVALASCAVRRQLDPIGGGASVVADARADVAAALQGLTERVRLQHPLVALTYGALAEVAAKHDGPRQRARNERERDRHRESLDALVLRSIEDAIDRDNSRRRSRRLTVERSDDD